MTPKTQRTIGWLIVIVAMVALATTRLRSQSAGNQQPEHFQRTFSIASGGTLAVDNYKERFTLPALTRTRSQST